jgi:hypothetical protein
VLKLAERATIAEQGRLQPATAAPAAAAVGLGRIVALHHRSSTSYQIH